MNTIYLTFPGGKHKVLTMSYDDGKLEDRRLIEIMNQNGIKGTFHINSGIIPNDPERIQFSEMKDLYKGHEISTHTYHHPTIARCPSENIAQHVLADRVELEAAAGYPVKGLSYPNGSYDERIKAMLPFLGISYARTVNSTGTFAMPDDYYEWNPTCHHNRDLIETGKKFLDLFKTQYLYLMYVWGHSYEFTLQNNWELIEEFCQMMGGKEDIWYASNMDIINCLEDYKRLQVSADATFAYNPCAASVWVSVNKDIYEIKSGETVYFAK